MEAVLNDLEDLSTHINSDIRVLRMMLSDLEAEPDPDRAYGASIVAEHLYGMSEELDDLVHKAICAYGSET